MKTPPFDLAKARDAIQRAKSRGWIWQTDDVRLIVPLYREVARLRAQGYSDKAQIRQLEQLLDEDAT